jgi:ligand-binding SRPBCC domain-containing protein
MTDGPMFEDLDQAPRFSSAYSFTISTPLRAPAEQVWEHASSFTGVNRELWPLVRMTFPAKLQRLTPGTFPVGHTAFRSWILLFGVLPVEYDDLMLVKLEPGRGFSEVSTLLTVRPWRHQRSILPSEEGCVVRDEIGLTPRWPGTGWFLAPLYRWIFVWRHRRLRRLFGARVSRATEVR